MEKMVKSISPSAAHTSASIPFFFFNSSESVEAMIDRSSSAHTMNFVALCLMSLSYHPYFLQKELW